MMAIAIYAAATMRDHVARLQEAFAGLDPLICYAVKANSNLAVLDLLRKKGYQIEKVTPKSSGAAATPKKAA